MPDVMTMLADAEDYYWRMAARGRLLWIETPQGPGTCTFFLLADSQEVPRYYARPCWSVPDDTSMGTLIYIDKLVVPHFTRKLWDTIELKLSQVIPAWTRAIWYRPGREADRCYHYKRRLDGADLYRESLKRH